MQVPVLVSRASPAHFDAKGLESLLLNLDRSLGVYTRAQFFTWTQGLLQSLIPHKVVICALRNGKPTSFTVDSFSTVVADSDTFGEVLLKDAAIASDLIKTWKERSFLPVACSINELGVPSGGAFARGLRRIGATDLLVHGTHDIDAQVRCLFIFGCGSGCVSAREIYTVQLIVPFLHRAWVRSQTAESQDAGCVASLGAGVLTKREREILHWVYLGKSNAEAAAILGISPLTVKNHVQKILRKLNVVNRAQAVGRALDARIISSDGIIGAVRKPAPSAASARA